VPTAIYSTAAYQVPLVNIVQTSLTDVIFPDMVKRAQKDPMEGLKLWKRAQMMVFAVICPSWMLMTYFAEPLVRFLFTDAYAPATPYFQVFLLLMLRQCFQFSTLLRSVEDNASFASSSAVSLAINAALILLLMPHYGLWGPTIGLVAGQMWSGYYLGRRVMQRYKVPLGGIYQWRKFWLSVLASSLALGAMHATILALPPAAISAAAGALVFGIVYTVAARFILSEEYGYVLRALTRRRQAT
jgi:O-antigen/teichoic acid export membrane protein